ncbi:tetratricopeptide repeat protein [Algoriphagus sp. Y33]|uniref:tetratricopeptide repeat-containing sensor histidine kinase n=1 Tax=Algoriphagus sp. Y33 TaxID=2772483 RepID=UPI00177E081C|nr:tetratricopeptide repeat protein [Algoriphagus sp. Y33]
MRILIFISIFSLISAVAALAGTPEEELNSHLTEYAQFASTNPEKAWFHAKKMLELSKEYELPVFTAKAHYAIGNLYFKQGNYDSTVVNLKTAIQLLDNANVENGKPVAFSLMGLAYKYKGDLTNSMHFLQKSLEWAQKLKEENQEANAYQNIALIYFQQKKYLDAANNLDLAVQIYHKLDDYSGIMSTRFNFANILKEQGEFEKARNFYGEALTYYTQTENLTKQAHIEMNLGQMLVEEGKYNEAFNLLLETREKLTRLNYTADLAIVLNDLGLCARAMGRNEIALEYFRQALSKTSDDLYFKADLLQNISNLYLKMKDYESALAYYRQSVESKEAYTSLEKEKHLAEIQAQYEDQLKESKILLLEQEKSLQEAEIQKSALSLKRQRVIRNFMISGFILIIIGLLVLRYFYRQKIVAQQRLAEQQEENARRKTSEIIKDFRLKAIERYQEGQQEERKRIAREIHDGIGSDLAGIKMAVEHHLGRTPEDTRTQRILLGLQDACKAVRSISHQLHPPPFAQTDFCAYLSDFVDGITENVEIEVDKIFYPTEEIDKLPDELLAEVYRIVQELLNNSIKHAQASVLELQLSLHEAYLNIMVSDNGIGMPQKAALKGIGMRNISERVEMLKGKLEIDSSPGNGASISIDLPVTS